MSMATLACQPDNREPSFPFSNGTFHDHRAERRDRARNQRRRARRGERRDRAATRTRQDLRQQSRPQDPPYRQDLRLPLPARRHPDHTLRRHVRLPGVVGNQHRPLAGHHRHRPHDAGHPHGNLTRRGGCQCRGAHRLRPLPHEGPAAQRRPLVVRPHRGDRRAASHSPSCCRASGRASSSTSSSWPS